MIKLSQVDIEKSLSTVYDLGNASLYDLCRNNYAHKNANEIIAKTVIIGRTYAASLDRGRKKNKIEKELANINDDFYLKTIVPLFKKSKIDLLLKECKKIKNPQGNEIKLLQIHGYLTQLLRILNGEEKRSFCSKYLHFHLPDLFFMYDSRAKEVISKFVNKKEVIFFTNVKVDSQYADFFSKAVHLQKEIMNDWGIMLTPRQIDNLFLKEANNILRNKIKT